MMNHNFVTKEQAIQLEALGFDEPCFGGYLKDESAYYAALIHYPCGVHNVTHEPKTYGKKSHVNKHITKAPLNQQVIEWAREKHELYLNISNEFYHDGVNINWQIKWNTYQLTPDPLPITNGTCWYGDNGEYRTYHAVLKAAIDKIIELINNPNKNEDPIRLRSTPRIQG